MSESDEEYDEFEEQLRLEREEKERRSRCSNIEHGSTRTDPDGTVYEWDADKMAYFPKIDANFIAQYQMGYGSYTEEEKKPENPDKPAKPADNTTDWSQYFIYVQKYTAEHGTYPPEMTQPHIEYYNQLYNYYYPTQGGQKSSEKKSEKKDDSENSGKKVEDSEKVEKSEGKSLESEEKSTEEEQTGKADEEKEETAEEKAYREYYEYYQQYYQRKPEEGDTAEDQEQREFDEWAYYNYYYGHEGEEETKEEEGKEKDSGEAEEGEDKDKKKRKAPEQGWFEIEHTKNTNVYVSGLPDDITEDEYKELMNKCGMIAYDPRTQAPKLKLYRDADGKPKGDGLCCYIKTESVGLALQMLDEYDVRGHKISVEVAKFEMKGKFDPKKRKKLSTREKKKIREQQQKMFDWRPDKPKGYRPKHERIIVIKNAFDYIAFEKDPKKIQVLREELRAQCVNFGTVKKVIVYDRHKEGIVTVAFLEVAEADLARESLHGRFFQGRQIHVEPWDGKTKYDVQETEAEREARLKQWQTYLESGGEEPAPGTGAGTKTKTGAGTETKIGTDKKAGGGTTEGTEKGKEPSNEMPPPQSKPQTYIDNKPKAEHCSEGTSRVEGLPEDGSQHAADKEDTSKRKPKDDVSRKQGIAQVGEGDQTITDSTGKGAEAGGADGTLGSAQEPMESENVECADSAETKMET